MFSDNQENTVGLLNFLVLEFGFSDKSLDNSLF